ncbi:hypothetical protein GPECTOR_6g856 [Gonium pectorale]|uniref:A to I editase domain-containing protein n=1 Tax=Gonium pectorale TaxID=33097 RepID=A0A150GW66_GONPE|nr:hypothetical protein GPECTOR_6g856 [Gonium pectorale]|eukprot:KXZ53938.1 hypothetical protein GPECTOR_6g856 [Gonium pectorale]
MQALQHMELQQWLASARGGRHLLPLGMQAADAIAYPQGLRIKAGPDHAPTFTARVAITTALRGQVVQEGSGSTCARAEHAAARAALQLLRGTAQPPPAPVPGNPPQPKTPLQKLHELVSQGAWHLEQATEPAGGAPHRPIWAHRTWVNGVLLGVGAGGPRKALAEEQAAGRVLAALGADAVGGEGAVRAMAQAPPAPGAAVEASCGLGATVQRLCLEALRQLEVQVGSHLTPGDLTNTVLAGFVLERPVAGGPAAQPKTLFGHRSLWQQHSLLRWLYSQGQAAVAAAATATASSQEAIGSGRASGSSALRSSIFEVVWETRSAYAVDSAAASTAGGASCVGPCLRVRPGVRLHMFISKPPCGDATVSRAGEGSASRVAAELRRVCDTAAARLGWHLPTDCCLLDPTNAATASCGKLRAKPAVGSEALSPLPRPGQEAELELAKVSCSDKLARWNALGLQGALLGALMGEPLYLSSITVAIGSATAERCTRGALARAVCCRLRPHSPPRPPGEGQGTGTGQIQGPARLRWAQVEQRSLQMPVPFRVAHPALHLTTASNGLRAGAASGGASSARSLNWNAGEWDVLEVTRGFDGGLEFQLPLHASPTVVAAAAGGGAGRLGPAAGGSGAALGSSAAGPQFSRLCKSALGECFARLSGALGNNSSGQAPGQPLSSPRKRLRLEPGDSATGAGAGQRTYGKAKRANAAYGAARALLYGHFQALTGQGWLRRSERVAGLEDFPLTAASHGP